MDMNKERTNAFLLHISAFAGFIFPFGNIITPLIAWQTFKNRSAYLDEQGKEAVNFNISYTLYIFIISLFLGGFIIGSIFPNFNNINLNINASTIFSFVGLGSLLSIAYLAAIALVIIASLKAKNGENYKYPFTIKFIK